jgi:O-antigen ligase
MKAAVRPSPIHDAAPLIDVAPGAGSSVLERGALVLIAGGVLMLPFGRVLGLPVAGSFVELCDVLFALAGLLWLVALIGASERLRWQPAYLALAGYVGLCAASFFVAPGRRAWLVHSAAAVYQAGLCVMIAHVLASAARRRIVVGAWLGAAAFTSALGLIGVALFYLGVKERVHNPFLWNYGSVPVGNYPRLYVLFRNGNALCSYLLVSIGLALAFGRDWSRLWPRWVALGIAATLLVALFTLSPGVGGIGLMLGLWVVWSRHPASGAPVFGRGVRRAALCVGASAALGFFVLALVSVVPRGQGALALGPVDLVLAGSPRVSVWSSAARLFGERPLLGQGLGSPSAWITDPRVFVPRDHWSDAVLSQHFEPRASDAHNTALSLLSQLGVSGFALFAAFIVLLFKQLGSAPRAAASGLAAALVGGLLYHGLFASLEEMRHLWLLFGLTLAVVPERPQPRAASAGFASTGLPDSS